jgi:ribosomal protein S18 acetylase RimI-like enzyme
MVIREFSFDQDYQAALALWAASGPGVHVSRSDAPDELRKKLARDPDLFLVAEAEGQLAGTVLGGFDGRRGMVYHLAVIGERRGRGIGQALMAELEARLRAKGCLRCYLMVDGEVDGLLAFYQRQGWEVMDIVAMSKDLDRS